MHKSILLAALFSCFLPSIIIAKARKKNEPIVQVQMEDDFESFEHYIDAAFEKGALDKPVEMKPPSCAEQIFRTVGVWLGMKAVAAKHYVLARWQKVRHYVYAKA
ncbi:MAG TPA: hypothetical protein VFF04_02075 [Candidatus Babeliales bacterium]|nr:hypothetical protein [Candidatus Babeliales bacterium]